MNRRTALRNVSLLGLSTALLGKKAWAGLTANGVHPNGLTPAGGPPPSPFHRFTMGTLELTVVTDGHINIKGIQPFFAPGVDSNKVSRLLQDHFLSTKESDLSINVLVVKSGNKVILIDTGCGANFGETSGWLTQNLVAAGIQPSAVTDIVLSHGHPDHLGGLVAKDGTLVFPNATHYISRIEQEFWTSAHPDFSKSRTKDPAMLQMVTGLATRTLAAVKPKLKLFEDNASILDCIRVKIVPGHTPGHTVTTVYSGNEELVHVADLVHSAVLVFAHPEWGFEGDTDFDLAVRSRKATLEQLAQKRQLVFSYHLPWPGLGHVKRQGEAYEWEQTPFAIPG